MREMQQSNIPWIGDIPSQWSVQRVKHLIETGENGMKIGPYGSSLSGKTLAEGPVKIYNQANLIADNFDIARHFISAETYEDLKNYTILPGDILFSMMGTIGKCKVMPEGKQIGIMDSHLLKARLNDKIIPRFFLYAFDKDNNAVTLDQLIFMSNGSIMNGLNSSVVKNVRMAVPSVHEQQEIVSFLDSKCAAIDEAIERHKKAIEKLEEYRKVEISRAVTTGMNPSVEWKYSGNKCTGMIPAHWGYCKILYVLAMPITDGPHETPEAVDEGIPFISAEAVSQGNGKIDFDHMWGYISQDFYEYCCKKYIPQKDDIYMIKSGATTGKVAMVDTDRIFTIWSPLAVLRVNKQIMTAKYLFYYVQSNGYQQQVELGWNYGTQQNIGMRMVERLKVCVPPIDEQKAITEHLDKKWNEINIAIDKEHSLISKLQEYRKSLIYHAVTGKIDCREESAS